MEKEDMTLGESIEQFKKQMAGAAPKEVLKTIGDEIRKLSESGIKEKALKPGVRAPDFSLPDPQGKIFSLSDLFPKGPVVLTFYRGSWCPFCNLQLRAYQKALPEIKKMGATLVAISPQTPDHSLSFVEKAELTFPVLSDQGNSVARQYGLDFKFSEALQSLAKGFGNELPKFNGDDSWVVPMPGTFIIDQAGVIRFASVNPDWLTRLEPSAILEELKKLNHG